MPAQSNMTQDFGKTISDVMNAMDHVGTQLSTAFLKDNDLNSPAARLLLIFFSLNVAYHLVGLILNDSSKSLSSILRSSVVTISIFYVFSMWPTVTKWSQEIPDDLSHYVVNTAPEMQGRQATEVVVEKFGEALGTMYKAAFPPITSAKPSSIFMQIMSSVPGVTSISSAISLGQNVAQGSLGVTSTILSTVLSLVIIFGAMAFVLFSLVSFIFILNIGTMMLIVGMCLGPILLPFLVFPNGDGPAKSWIKFMFSALLYKVVAVIVAIISLSSIKIVVDYASKMADAQDSIIFLSMIILFFAALGSRMMGRADNMASAFGGNSSSIGDGSGAIFTAITTVTKAISSGGKSVGKTLDKSSKLAASASSSGLSAAAKVAASSVNPSAVAPAAASAASSFRSKLAAARARNNS